MGHGCHDCGVPNGCICGQLSEEEVQTKKIETHPGVIAARKLVADAQKKLAEAVSIARSSLVLEKEIEEAEARLRALKSRRR